MPNVSSNIVFLITVGLSLRVGALMSSLTTKSSLVLILLVAKDSPTIRVQDSRRVHAQLTDRDDQNSVTACHRVSSEVQVWE